MEFPCGILAILIKFIALYTLISRKSCYVPVTNIERHPEMTHVPVGRYDGQGPLPVTGRDRQGAGPCARPTDRHEAGWPDPERSAFPVRFAESDGTEDGAAVPEVRPFRAEDVSFVASLSMARVSGTDLSSCLQGRAVHSGFSERESGPDGQEGAPNRDGEQSDFLFGTDRTRKGMLVRPAPWCDRRVVTCSGASLGGVCGRLTRVVPLGFRLEPNAAHAAKRPRFSCTSAVAKVPGKSSRKRRSSRGRPPWPLIRELSAVAGTGGRPNLSSHEDGAGVASRLARLSVGRSPAAGSEPQRKRTTVAFRALVSAA